MFKSLESFTRTCFCKASMMSRIFQSPGRFSPVPIMSYITGELDKSGQVGGLIRTGKLTYY